MNEPTQPKDRWYRRAGRKTKRILRKALLPTLFLVSVGAAGYGGFQAGRVYTHMQYESPLEETLMHERTERRVIRRGDRLYLHTESEENRMLDLDTLTESMGSSDSKSSYVDIDRE